MGEIDKMNDLYRDDIYRIVCEVTFDISPSEEEYEKLTKALQDVVESHSGHYAFVNIYIPRGYIGSKPYTDAIKDL